MWFYPQSVLVSMPGVPARDEKICSEGEFDAPFKKSIFKSPIITHKVIGTVELEILLAEQIEN
jgi:hypothetical protein